MKKLKGLIYCRVSSTKQVSDGSGLSSQEQTCRNYARNILGVEIEKVFNEEGISGGLFDRKSINELFAYIDVNKQENYVVIFEDLNRLSRDIQVHGLLKAEFKKRGVELACPNFQFDETPEGNFKENISVVVSEYERKKNQQRVIDRQQARLEQGFWCFCLPIGYKYSKDPRGGKIVVKNEDNYKIVKKGLEDYSNGKLGTHNELVLFFHSKGLKVGTVVKGKVYNANLVSRILRNILYTGYIEYPNRNIELMKAQHEGIISMDTFKKIQKRLSENPVYITHRIEENLNRKDLSADFPLRGFLHCYKSGYMLSGAWSQGKQKKYPYYCYPRYSENKGKSINREVMHTQFEKYLQDIKLDPYFIKSFKEMYHKTVQSKGSEIAEFIKGEKDKILKIESKITKYIERIGKTESETIISNYENEVENLEKEKSEINENITNLSKTIKNVRTPLNEKLKKYENTLYIWKNGDLNSKKKLLKEVFPDGIPIDEKKQVRTPTLSLIYRIIKTGESSIEEMVDRPGLEPGT